MCEVYIVKETAFPYNTRHRNAFREKIPMTGLVPSLGFSHFLSKNKNNRQISQRREPKGYLPFFTPSHSYYKRRDENVRFVD